MFGIRGFSRDSLTASYARVKAQIKAGGGRLNFPERRSVMRSTPGMGRAFRVLTGTAWDWAGAVCGWSWHYTEDGIRNYYGLKSLFCDILIYIWRANTWF